MNAHDARKEMEQAAKVENKEQAAHHAMLGVGYALVAIAENLEQIRNVMARSGVLTREKIN